MIKKEKLLRKGWAEEEIHKAESILNKEQTHDMHFSKIVFWTSLVVVVIANLLISLILIPFLIVLNKTVLYSVVIVLAAIIGFLYTFLIRDIGHLKKKHHISAGVIIPIIAIGNVIAMVLVSNRFITDLGIENPQHNPWVTAIVFAGVFIIPYIIDVVRGRFN